MPCSRRQQQAALQQFEPEEARDHRARRQARSRRQHAAPERRGVHVRLHGHAAHVSRTRAGRRRAVPHECRQGQHRRRGSSSSRGRRRIDLHHRRERRLSRRDHRRASTTFRSRCCRPDCVEGNVLPFAPEWQGHVGVAYTAMPAMLDITPRVDASYQDDDVLRRDEHARDRAARRRARR